jgi:hypothetical protein
MGKTVTNIAVDFYNCSSGVDFFQNNGKLKMQLLKVLDEMYLIHRYFYNCSYQSWVFRPRPKNQRRQRIPSRPTLQPKVENKILAQKNKSIKNKTKIVRNIHSNNGNFLLFYTEEKERNDSCSRV